MNKKRTAGARFGYRADIKRRKLGPKISKDERLKAQREELNILPGGEISLCDTCAAHNPKKKKK